MSSYQYNIVADDGIVSSVTVFAGAEQYSASADNPKFKAIIAAVKSEAPLEEVEELFDVSKPLAAKFARLSDRVTIANGNVYFDGDEVHGAVVDTIVRFHAEGNEDFKPLVKFLDKVGQNPNEHSRENLGRWLVNRSFSITEDGDIIAYKYVAKTVDHSTGKANYTSARSGPDVSVNDVPVPANVKGNCNPGDVVAMPRSKVEFDPKVPCSRGLHVGTWSFAHGYGRTVIEVLVNPRDVVSVPTDCNDQKMRTCRYVALAEVNAPRKNLYQPLNVPKPVAPKVAPIPVSAVKDTPAPVVTPEAVTATIDAQADYAEYRAKDFAKLSRDALRRIAKAWKEASKGKVAVTGNSKDDLAKALAKQAGNIRWNRKCGQGFQG